MPAALPDETKRLEGVAARLRDGLRDDLLSGLNSALFAAQSLQEANLALLLDALSTAIRRGDVGLLSAKDEARVLEWARKARAGAHRSVTVFVRVGVGVVPVHMPIADKNTLAGVIAVALALPWAEQGSKCVEPFVGAVLAAGLVSGGPASWKAATELRRAVLAWAGGHKGPSDPDGYARAALRIAAGFSARKADDAVRSFKRRRSTR